MLVTYNKLSVISGVGTCKKNPVAAHWKQQRYFKTLTLKLVTTKQSQQAQGAAITGAQELQRPPLAEDSPVMSVVPENIAKVHKKNRHSHSPGHKLRRCNFVARAKRFT